MDRSGRIVRVMGKGSKERLCPVNAQSIRALEAYLVRRGELLATPRPGQEPEALFLNYKGGGSLREASPGTWTRTWCSARWPAR